MLEISAQPTPALLDEEIVVRVTGAQQASRVRIRGETTDAAGRMWFSEATYVCGSDEIVDTARDQSIAGTYQGVDPFGLWWSMRPTDSRESGYDLHLQGMDIRLEATSKGQTTSCSVRRLVQSPDVDRTFVRADGLTGVLFSPTGASSTAGVIVLSGSGGGAVETSAALLASRGYLALALPYFAYPGLPDELCEIELEYFQGAIRWMRRLPEMDGCRLIVMGSSRGGELALLLGATFSEVSGVVAIVPSNHVFGSVGANPATFGRPAWVLGGQPVPFVGQPPPGQDPEPPFWGAVGDEEPVALTPGYLEMLARVDPHGPTAIPVERIRGPVLLISGDQDAMWPSNVMAGEAVRRLAGHDHQYPVIHFKATGTGHAIGLPNLPTTVNQAVHSIVGRTFAFGGQPQSRAIGLRSAWAQILSFLDGYRNRGDGRIRPQPASASPARRLGDADAVDPSA